MHKSSPGLQNAFLNKDFNRNILESCPGLKNAFLDNDFLVKVSATDIRKEDKYKHLVTLDHSDHLHISELDVLDKVALQDFVFDCDIVIHGGTPFLLDFQDAQKQLFEPTIKGTENFLEVVNTTPGIEKVVFIASVAAWNTNFPMPAGTKSFTDTFDENDVKFSSIESHPYAQAKFMANQVVEKFNFCILYFFIFVFHNVTFVR